MTYGALQPYNFTMHEICSVRTNDMRKFPALRAFPEAEIIRAIGSQKVYYPREEELRWGCWHGLDAVPPSGNVIAELKSLCSATYL